MQENFCSKPTNLSKKYMEFNEAVEFLYSLIDYEKRKGYVESLEPYLNFLKEFDNPHLKVPRPILIVGTKGKGSTAHLVAGGLQSLGFKVGLFTSPHLVDIRERIKINNKKIPERAFTKYIELIKPHIEGKRGFKTVFETLTLMAFLYFIDEKVDYAVFEAGLGGRLDATNVLSQILTIITNISYDHMDILGPKLTDIAREKAAVIKNSNPVVVARQHPSVYQVIKKACEKTKAKMYLLSEYAKYKLVEAKLNRTLIKYKGLSGEKLLLLNQGGIFQAKNMALSALALEVLGFENFNFEGIKIEGRFEVISENPLIIIDGSHNYDSVKNFLNSTLKIIGNDCVFVFGINRDKEYEKIIKEIVKVNPSFIIVTHSQSPRALSSDELLQFFLKNGMPKEKIKSAENVQKAIEIARKKGNKVLAFGSFYLAGEIKQTLLSVNF
uniref:tetrahydrofolate synthase n=1 Tax=candidate division WOR-3 bacterium TaxID=2052148 RepID=A0A7V3ZZG4_UNCW3